MKRTEFHRLQWNSVTEISESISGYKQRFEANLQRNLQRKPHFMEAGVPTPKTKSRAGGTGKTGSVTNNFRLLKARVCVTEICLFTDMHVQSDEIIYV